MAKHTFTVQPRDISGRQVKRLRSQGLIPGVVYGKHAPCVNVQFSAKAFLRLLSEVGESSLIYLTLSGDSKQHPTLLREIARDPLTGSILHVSFNEVSLTEKVTAKVPLRLIGESPAEREKLGILVQQIDEVEVSALPADLPEGFNVDISRLDSVGSAIFVADLNFDQHALTLLTPPDTIIVQIAPLSQEEAAPLAEPAPASETENISPSPSSLASPENS